MDGSWLYPPLEFVMQAAGLETMETYIFRHQNKVTHYIETRPIIDICMEAEWRPVTRVLRLWW